MFELSLHILLNWILQHGSIVLFILLALGIVGLPIPDESLLVLSGVLMAQGKLHILPTVCAALFGSMVGITVSYLLGRTLGHYVLLKIGRWIGLTKERLDVAHVWFEQFGKWLLVFGYFIPGVRHFTGVVAGLAELDVKSFMLFAYSGATLWATVFLSLGYLLSDHISELLSGSYHHFFLVFTALIILLLFALYLKFRITTNK